MGSQGHKESDMTEQISLSLSLHFAIPKSGREGTNFSSSRGSLGRGEEGLYKVFERCLPQRKCSRHEHQLFSCMPVIPLALGTFLGSLLLPVLLAIIMSPTPT